VEATTAMTQDWLAASPDAAAVLVTVVAAQGSVPRGAGTKMLVTQDAQYDTIGGGHLELRAADIARAMLAAHDSHAHAERFALGPSLGQCCGGAVQLLFEPVGEQLAAVLACLRQRRRQDSWRLAPFDGGQGAVLLDAEGQALAGATAPDLLSLPEAARAAQVVAAADGRRWLLDPCLAPRAHLTLFGNGHVGAAIVRALEGLPCHISWVDEREELFPASVAGNVTVEVSDAPEQLVDAAPAGGSFLVMTHSHALDQRLTEAILTRSDAGWFGLIGSDTKRAQFENRLRMRGVPQARIDAMVCPVGLPGISGKAPAVIAASVCAQLLMVWEAAGLA
jgi:xanthine dehydrogenase accessory factor